MRFISDEVLSRSIAAFSPFLGRVGAAQGRWRGRKLPKHSFTVCKPGTLQQLLRWRAPVQVRVLQPAAARQSRSILPDIAFGPKSASLDAPKTLCFNTSFQMCLDLLVEVKVDSEFKLQIHLCRIEIASF